MTEIYVETENYRAAVDAIAAMTGRDPDDIKTAMGEGNIWPMSIRADVIKQSGPEEEDEADLLEDGSTPTPDPDFIDEEEDENPKGVVR